VKSLSTGSLDQQLADTAYIKDQNWAKILAISKRQFDEWATRRLCAHGYEDFKMVYMPVLMNIKPEGNTNNNELAAYAKVTKQAMSKVAKELQHMGYIKGKASAQDKRITIFSLTERGKKLVVEARLAVKELMDIYRTEFGEAEFNQSLRLMQRIILFNDEKLLKQE
jgi:DNA-binding MarR family transcriptional regulator